MKKKNNYSETDLRKKARFFTSIGSALVLIFVMVLDYINTSHVNFMFLIACILMLYYSYKDYKTLKNENLI
ncbi:MAG: hypothetical protein SOZ89_04655 [Peptoniphilaceae bacterium]|nr:hypothetical protein [Peptoniphilaceae bacterium]MDD7383172.1 hypothetical protein [Peptoniphilaceae bacterium]MDY3738396.1 hypothetical protein [Peptoniphilaceae bacterium]